MKHPILKNILLKEDRIVDVEVAPPNVYKWQALIFIDDLYMCEGSLIGE